MAKGAIQINREHETRLVVMISSNINYLEGYCYRHQEDEHSIIELEELHELFQEVKGISYEQYQKEVKEIMAADRLPYKAGYFEECPF